MITHLSWLGKEQIFPSVVGSVVQKPKVLHRYELSPLLEGRKKGNTGIQLVSNSST